MELPDSLPAQLYLLTYNPDKDRMGGVTQVGYLDQALRAAALVDLLHRGRISDQSGKVVLVPGPRAVGPASAAHTALEDLVSARVLDQIEGSGRPRPWRHWVEHDHSGTTRAVRDYLESGRWLRVDRDRVLGLFPRTHVSVRDSRSVKALRAEVLGALRGPTAVDRLDRRARVLAALGALADMRVLESAREARSHRERTAQLAEVLGPVGPALRDAISAAAAVTVATTAATSAGG